MFLLLYLGTTGVVVTVGDADVGTGGGAAPWWLGVGYGGGGVLLGRLLPGDPGSEIGGVGGGTYIGLDMGKTGGGRFPLLNL